MLRAWPSPHPFVTSFDALRVCTSGAPFLREVCAEAPTIVRAAPAAALWHADGAARMSAAAIVCQACQYGSSPVVVRSCAAIRDALMGSSSPIFRSVALLVSEFMLAQGPSASAWSEGGEEMQGCIERYTDRSLASIVAHKDAVASVGCSREETPFFMSGLHRAGVVLEANELRELAPLAPPTATALVPRGDPASMPGSDALRAAYRRAVSPSQRRAGRLLWWGPEGGEASFDWTHGDLTNDTFAWMSWTRVRGHGTSLMVAPHDRLSVMCWLLEQDPPAPRMRRLSREQFFFAIYETAACPVHLSPGEAVLLDASVPHRAAMGVANRAVRAFWSSNDTRAA